MNSKCKRKVVFICQYIFLKRKIFRCDKIGRKRKDNKSVRPHNKYSNDNMTIKSKTNALKSIIETFKNLSGGKILKSPKYEIIIKDGTKDFNISLLNLQIWEILTLNYNKDYQEFNETLLSQFISNNLVLEIMCKTFNDYISTDFLLSNIEYNEKYGFDSKF